MSVLYERPAWHKKAACRGRTEIMFTVYKTEILRAKMFCARCPVIEECLQAALDADEHPVGVWGGQSERSLQRMRRKLGKTERKNTEDTLEEVDA